MTIIYWVYVLLACAIATNFTTARSKNTFKGKMGSRIATRDSFREIASEVGFEIRKALHGEGLNVNMKVIEETINKNYGKKNMFKKLLAKNPSWEKHILFTEGGWRLVCGTGFCKKGNGFYGFGLCSPNICRCNFGEAEKHRCRNGTVYDPTYLDCNFPRNVKSCGEN